jgi:hypothetical protein
VVATLLRASTIVPANSGASSAVRGTQAPAAGSLVVRVIARELILGQASVLSLGLSRMSRLARRKGATVKVTLPLAPVEGSLVG